MPETNCGDEYLVVRVEAPPTHDELPVLCLGCDGVLCNREGKFALKYFRINDGSAAHSVNTPPAKAGGFGSRLEAGYNRPFGSIVQTTLKLSSGSSGFWSSIYFFHTSSVTFPLEATQYPLLHKCWPQ
jgi:hypothetical protein